MTASAANCNLVNLSWTASTDKGGSGLKGYNVYRSGAFVAQVLAPNTSYYDTGRASSTSYSYTVQAAREWMRTKNNSCTPQNQPIDAPPMGRDAATLKQPTLFSGL